MNKKNRKTEEVLILVTVLLLLTLSMIVFNKVLPVSFESITGKVVTRVNITQPPVVNCSFTLYNGLNLVSFFCIPNMISPTDVVGSLSNLEGVFDYQEGNSDAWTIYNPNLPSFVVQDLTIMSRTEGYWIRMRANENFFLDGRVRLPNNILLVPGWNLAGYPTNQIKLVNQSFSSIDGNFTEVRTYNASSGSFISYVPGVGGALTQTEPYYGYWINATVSEVWVVD
ncbi:hypothetical protein KY348_03565 [Candidatus Woesearchaeota archaeon]|nr:hypothetical protein [Candidatus Woesearchaeota archaeon]